MHAWRRTWRPIAPFHGLGWAQKQVRGVGGGSGGGGRCARRAERQTPGPSLCISDAAWRTLGQHGRLHGPFPKSQRVLVPGSASSWAPLALPASWAVHWPPTPPLQRPGHHPGAPQEVRQRCAGMHMLQRPAGPQAARLGAQEAGPACWGQGGGRRRAAAAAGAGDDAAIWRPIVADAPHVLAAAALACSHDQEAAQQRQVGGVCCWREV